MTSSNMHYFDSNENHVHSGSYLHKVLKNIFLFFLCLMDDHNEVFKEVVPLKFILK